MQEPLLSIQQLNIVLRQEKTTRALTKDVSFDVQAGEIHCLVGESGCGKSITALSILRLLPSQVQAASGAILFEGQNLLSLSEKELDGIRGKGIGMVYQDVLNSLNPVLPIGLQMVEGMHKHLATPRKEAKERALQLLRRTGVSQPEKRMRQFPHQLSGGMRQRVIIAMALAMEPKFLIADEPTTALDVTIQLQVIELLKSLRDETGMAILLITHDLGLVAEVADRVTVMYAGECVESGSAIQVLHHPTHPYTQALLQAIPDLRKPSQRLTAIPGSVPVDYGTLSGCRFAPRCPHAAECTQNPQWHDLAEGHQVYCTRPEVKA